MGGRLLSRLVKRRPLNGKLHAFSASLTCSEHVALSNDEDTDSSKDKGSSMTIHVYFHLKTIELH